ncbi:hypothetical protein MUK42_06135 [Musa troglodytarum]|uniref:Uncharacterized protein n=1 Tax=Musa troglodytarum TaxID=320322 RepID=A0A9E7HSK5_9LILI|nr:hypothetical protein MUK42_06135 [Musa troglodytarum]
MGLATKLLRHHRRLLFRPLSSSHPLFAPPQYHSHTPSLLCSDHSSNTFNPGRRPDNSFRSFSWFAWNPASDNDRDGGRETREDGNFGSSDLGSDFSPLRGSPTGVEPSIMGLDGPGMVEEVAGESVWSSPMRAGSLVYWVTNSSLTLFQLLALKNSFIRMKLGLRDEKVPLREQVSSEKVLPENNIHLMEISVDTLSPQKLLDIALEDLAAGRRNEALPLLEMAIEKDPELVRALIAMGQILCSQGSLVEAAKYFENAISKIQDDEDPFLLVATFGAGVSHLWQGNKLEGIKHLKRIAELKEPESLANKVCYHQGLVILGSTLFEEGNKSEAAKYLRIAATYDPGVAVYLKECEEAG